MKKLLVDAMLDMTMPKDLAAKQGCRPPQGGRPSLICVIVSDKRRTHPLNRLGDWGTFYPCGSRWDILHCSTPELLSRRLERIKPEIPR